MIYIQDKVTDKIEPPKARYALTKYAKLGR